MEGSCDDCHFKPRHRNLTTHIWQDLVDMRHYKDTISGDDRDSLIVGDCPCGTKCEKDRPDITDCEHKGAHGQCISYQTICNLPDCDSTLGPESCCISTGCGERHASQRGSSKDGTRFSGPKPSKGYRSYRKIQRGRSGTQKVSHKWMQGSLISRQARMTNIVDLVDQESTYMRILQ
jgi:hypothetical protein